MKLTIGLAAAGALALGPALGAGLCLPLSDHIGGLHVPPLQATLPHFQTAGYRPSAGRCPGRLDAALQGAPARHGHCRRAHAQSTRCLR